MTPFRTERTPRVRKLVLVALLAACALAVHTVEAAFPLPYPGLKLGIANVFSLSALMLLGAPAALAVTALRVFLSALFSANLFAFTCAAAGGFAALGAMIPLYRWGKTVFGVPAISAAGATAFNVAQVAVASFWIGSASVFYLLPVLLAAGLATGWGTGVLADILCQRVAPLLGQTGLRIS